MKYFLLFISVFFLFLMGCEKEANRKLLGAYFKFNVNGEARKITDEIADANTFDCFIVGDTALFINVREVYEGAGFVIKTTNIKDGTYRLDSLNKAYYTNPKDYKRYTTNNSFTGTITIRKDSFQAKTLLRTLHGSFSYQAYDTATRKSFNITDGEFLMEQR